VKKAGDEVNDQTNDDGTKQIRECRMGKCNLSYSFRSQVGVRHLNCHADRQGQVGKIEIGRGISSLKSIPPWGFE
jgi:hypothetical protein